MKILVIDDEEAVREITILNLENLDQGSEIIEADCSLEAIKYIKNEDKIDLIICDYNMPNGSGANVYNYLRKTVNSAIPFILFSSSNPLEIDIIDDMMEDTLSLYLEKPLALDSFKEVVTQFLSNLSCEDSSGHLFLRIRLLYLLRYDFSGVDLFIRLNKKKYIKLIHHDDKLDQDILNRLLGRGVKYLYISKNNNYQNQTDVTSHPFLYSKETNLIQKQAKTRLILHSILVDLGISKESITQTYDQITELVKLLKRQKLGSDFKQFMNSNNSLYDQSFILSALLNEVTKHLPWHNPQTANKLGIARVNA